MEKYSEVTKVGESYLSKFASGKERQEVLDKVALSYFRLGNYEKRENTTDKFLILQVLKNTENFKLRIPIIMKKISGSS